MRNINPNLNTNRNPNPNPNANDPNPTERNLMWISILFVAVYWKCCKHSLKQDAIN